MIWALELFPVSKVELRLRRMLKRGVPSIGEVGIAGGTAESRWLTHFSSNAIVKVATLPFPLLSIVFVFRLRHRGLTAG